jgi:hypothetical protein
MNVAKNKTFFTNWETDKPHINPLKPENHLFKNAIHCPQQ